MLYIPHVRDLMLSFSHGDFFFQCISNIISWIHVFMFIVSVCIVLLQQNSTHWVIHVKHGSTDSQRLRLVGSRPRASSWSWPSCFTIAWQKMEGQQQTSNGETASPIRRNLSYGYSVNQRFRVKLS